MLISIHNQYRYVTCLYRKPNLTAINQLISNCGKITAEAGRKVAYF